MNFGSPTQFETQICWLFHKLGYWAHRLARDERGAQPFDVIAIKGHAIFAVDCKVCSRPRLDITRAEINQMLAFTMLSKTTEARCGFMCYHKGDIYFIPYFMVEECLTASIPLANNVIWMRADRIKEIMEDGNDC